MAMQPLGKMLVLFGVVLVGVGLLLMFSDRIPLLGRLPGDISIKKDNFQIYIPVTTGLLISVVLSVVLWALSHFKGK